LIATEAGRDPADALRMAQLVGTITDTPGDRDGTEARAGSAPVRGTAEQPFRCVVSWPEQGTVGQVARFAREVVPAAKALTG
jgi:hypothetical protein